MVRLKPASECDPVTCIGGESSGKDEKGNPIMGGWICQCPCHRYSPGKDAWHSFISFRAR